MNKVQIEERRKKLNDKLEDFRFKQKFYTLNSGVFSEKIESNINKYKRLIKELDEKKAD